MSANYLSDNYRLRKHFLETNEVPTQSLIKKKMSAPLAAVYFKNMTPKLKVMVGLEPPMKGGGGDWYVPPKDLLEGRSVLKPLKKKYLSKLNYLGIDTLCINMLDHRIKCMQVEKNKIIAESDEKWKGIVEVECEQFYETASVDAAKKNTEKIRNAFQEFTNLYGSSLNTIENVLFDAACNQIKRIQNEARKAMKDKYKTSVARQATRLYDEYTNKMMKETFRIKSEFVENLTWNRTHVGDTIHDVNLEKHLTIEKSRKFLECQRLACQVYVALKEREECKKEMNVSKQMHKKKVKTLIDEIALKDYEIIRQAQKEKIRLEFDITWQKKVWHIVKKFQVFVSYCLNTLPAHADFFINMEKLMLLQLDEALENPSAESIFKVEDEYYEGPIPEPHPFYLFCDKSHKASKPRFEKDLCPKHCTSSASHMPVIVVNKRCMYAACDNFQQFTNKVKYYIYGKRGDDMDFIDDHIYEYDIPIKYQSSQQLSELKLESSLLQVLQQELPNVREAPIECGVCKTPHCFCYNTQAPKTVDAQPVKIQQPVPHTTDTSNKLNIYNADIDSKSEPIWESYLKSIIPKQCKCVKTVKKHLAQHLPVYMRSKSIYNPPHLPNYEVCPLDTLKKLVREARGVCLPTEETSQRKTRDMGTQYSDQEFDELCTCFSDDELQRLIETRTAAGSKLYHPSTTGYNSEYMGFSSTVMTAGASPFARKQAYSLLALLSDAP